LTDTVVVCYMDVDMWWWSVVFFFSLCYVEICANEEIMTKREAVHIYIDLWEVKWSNVAIDHITIQINRKWIRSFAYQHSFNIYIIIWKIEKKDSGVYMYFRFILIKNLIPWLSNFSEIIINIETLINWNLVLGFIWIYLIAGLFCVDGATYNYK